MSEHASAKPSFALEKRDHAIVARWQTKMMDEDHLETLIRAIDDATGADPAVTLVVLDLTCVSTMPSMALGLLMQLFNGCNVQGRKLKLAGLQPQIRQVFSVTRLDRVLQFADTVEAAMK